MENKKIWILNHYATDTFLNQGGRHYYFATNLVKKGYSVTIFCANTIHNSDKEIDLEGKMYKIEYLDGIKYVFIKSRKYNGNGKARIFNIFDYYKHVKKITKKFEKPDVIIGSSVHPWACKAAILLSKKYKCKNIVEIRDLWPLSIVEYSGVSNSNPLIKYLYHFEKKIYKRANALVFTMEGGKQYIIDKKWDKKIDLNKVYHINNGVDLELFEYNKNNFIVDDEDLNNPDTFKIVYTGSIRQADGLNVLIEACKLCKNDNIQFIIYGDGDERENLIEKCKEYNITNVKFKGRVDKKYVPNICSKANVNFMNLKPTPTILKYGVSLNKLFDYLAAGKLILSTFKCGFNYLDKYNCGITTENQEAETIKDAILQVYNMDKEEYNQMCENAKNAAKDYDFKVLTDKLIDIIENVTKGK